jgi:hypothetical protein
MAVYFLASRGALGDALSMEALMFNCVRKLNPVVAKAGVLALRSKAV